MGTAGRQEQILKETAKEWPERSKKIRESSMRAKRKERSKRRK